MSMLRQGLHGQEVATLQAALNYHLPLTPLLRVDSIFGPKTDVRVKEFQRRHNLLADGIVGPKTQAFVYACVTVSSCAFGVRQQRQVQRRLASVMAGRLSLLAPGGLQLSPPGRLQLIAQQLSSPFQLPPLTLPPLPPFLNPQLSSQLGPAQQVVWPAAGASWEFWTTELMFLSRKLEIKGEIEPEQAKMGSVPGWEVNVIGTATWTLLPERLRSPAIFLQAGAQTSVPPQGATGRLGFGINFKGLNVQLTVEGNSAFDVDPQGRAGSDKTVPETNFTIRFGGSF